MCDICDGKTQEDLLERVHDLIGGGQWALQGVEPGPRTAGWIYTVGLTHNFGHAELVIVTDDDPGPAAALLNELGARISRGLRADANASVDLGGYVVEFETVHHSYLLGGLCASWENYNVWTGRQPARLEVLQVVPPLAEWCDHCDRRRRCLASPGTPGFGHYGNRSARRAQARVRRRRT